MFSINHHAISLAGWFTQRAPAKGSCADHVGTAKMGLPGEGGFPGEILGLGGVLVRSPTFNPYKMLWVKVAAWYWMLFGCNGNITHWVRDCAMLPPVKEQSVFTRDEEFWPNAIIRVNISSLPSSSGFLHWTMCFLHHPASKCFCVDASTLQWLHIANTVTVR